MPFFVLLPATTSRKIIGHWAKGGENGTGLPQQILPPAQFHTQVVRNFTATLVTAATDFNKLTEELPLFVCSKAWLLGSYHPREADTL